jgi:hypothetical protein
MPKGQSEFVCRLSSSEIQESDIIKTMKMKLLEYNGEESENSVSSEAYPRNALFGLNWII